jgi:glycine hydroxymethyltransferase
MAELERDDIEALVRAHAAWRRRCVNLIASENVLSPAVRAQLATDLAGRYGDYAGRDAEQRKYFGTPYVRDIERLVNDLACRLFGARYAELRPLSGHVAGAGVLLGLCKPGDRVLEVGSDGGGHRMAAKLAEGALIDLDVGFLPFDAERWNVDVGPAIARIEQTRPRLVILGSSTFLFPHPVREIAEAVHRVEGAALVYDASHVMGLIAAGRFQQPLADGADLVFGSTHKTLPGPQGGLILTNDSTLIEAVTTAVYPALVTNHHLFRLPALGLALLEMQHWGAAYAEATVANAQRLGAELAQRSLLVVGARNGYTRSHTLLVGTDGHGGAETGALLERAGIIVTAARLPAALGRVGIRLGTQEITRLGAQEADMPALADLLAAAIMQHASPEELAPRVAAWVAERLGDCGYTWDRAK